MTICKVLAQGKRDGYDVLVYEKYEKYCGNPYYEIIVAENGIAKLSEKTAKTTWKKRFKEIID